MISQYPVEIIGETGDYWRLLEITGQSSDWTKLQHVYLPPALHTSLSYLYVWHCDTQLHKTNLYGKSGTPGRLR